MAEQETLECLDGPTGCEGPVEYRMALSGTGRSFPRCDRHWDERLDRQQEIQERYFGTPSSHYCKHGNYIGDPYGADYICGACENGDPEQTTYEGLLGELADILYPLDGYRGDQWNGGDVCEALAMLLDRYMPEARTRQPERQETCPTCNGAGATGVNGPDPDPCNSCRGTGTVSLTPGWDAYKAERERLGL